MSPPAIIEPMALTLGGLTLQLGVVARSYARPPGMRPVADSILTSGTHSWKENGHETISMTIISLPLIQECALTIVVNCLGGLPGNSVERLTDHP